MRATASSIPDWGTGSGVLISRVMTVRTRTGLVRRALVLLAKATIEARASFVNLVAAMVDVICLLFYNMMVLW